MPSTHRRRSRRWRGPSGTARCPPGSCRRKPADQPSNRSPRHGRGTRWTGRWSPFPGIRAPRNRAHTCSVGEVLPSQQVVGILRQPRPAIPRFEDRHRRDRASSARRRMRLTSSRRMFSRSESSVTAVLGCLFPRSRKRRHFGDDLGWHLNFGFFFLIWRPVNLRPLRWSERIPDDNGFSRGPARRLRNGIRHGLLRGPSGQMTVTEPHYLPLARPDSHQSGSNAGGVDRHARFACARR